MFMKILLISNGKWEFDGRLRELVKVAKHLGETKFITRVNSLSNKKEDNHIALSRNGYLYFIVKTIFEATALKKIDTLLIDNRKAIIPGLIINAVKKPKNIILDVRELYVSNEIRHLVGKIGCFFERLMIKKATVVISANIYRADYMEKYYNLKRTPLVFENIRKLVDYNAGSTKNLSNKYKDLFNKNTIKIISTSGYSINRTNDKLVEAMSELGHRFELLLVGGGSEKDKSLIKYIIDKKEISNVYLIDMVEAEELRYLIKQCDIGVVNYNQNDLNNKYCASGKIYEFLFEGLPVVTTENIPLVEICQKYGIGESDNEYINGIKNLANNYLQYKENVNNYLDIYDVDENNKQLINGIKQIL